MENIFVVNFPLKLFCAAVTNNADIERLLFGKYLDHMLVKLEQNRMVQNIQNFELCNKNSGFITIFDEALNPFWKMFL